MTAPLPAPQPQPADDQRLLSALDRAAATLLLQRKALAASGRPAAADCMAHELRELAAKLHRHEPMSAADSLKALCLSIEEIARRQEDLSAGTGKEGFEAIALEAFGAAMHRVRTCLDVALGCVEDISDLCHSRPDATQLSDNAASAAQQIRLVYHYANELTEMASMEKRLATVHAQPFDCAETLKRVAADMAQIAGESGIELGCIPASSAMPCNTSADLVRSALRYLLLLAIVSPGVTVVSCSIRRTATVHGSVTSVYVTDNGKGMSLVDRAALACVPGIYAGQESTAADLAGFAVARRLARALGGRLTLEYLAGRGSRAQIEFPTDYNPLGCLPL